MSSADERAKLLEQLKPPKSIERIHRFVDDLAARPYLSAAEPVAGAPSARPGEVGLHAAAFGRSIEMGLTRTTAAHRPDVLRDLMKRHQVSGAEVREFSLWLAKWNDRQLLMDLVRPAPQELPAPEAPAVRRRIAAVSPTAAVAGAETTVVRQRVREEVVVRRRFVDEPASTPGRPLTREERAVWREERRGRPTEPDALSRAWRAERAAPGAPPPPEVGASPLAAVTPKAVLDVVSRAVWTGNLSLGSMLVGAALGRGQAGGAALPQPLGAAAAGLAERPAAAFGYPLSRPPIPTASWLGTAPRQPDRFAPADLTSTQPPLGQPPLTPLATSQQALQPLPAAQMMPVRPALHAPALRPAGRGDGGPSAAGPPTRGEIQTEPPRSATRSTMRPVVVGGMVLYALSQAAPSAAASPMGLTLAQDVAVRGTGSAFLGVSTSGSVAQAMPQVDLLARAAGPAARPASAAAVTANMGEITLIAPPVRVASEKAERGGAAVAFDWRTLMGGAGQLDASGLARLKEVLPEGAQAIYPAVPRSSLGPSAMNLKVAPSLLAPLLEQSYGARAAGIAERAASLATAQSGGTPASAPLAAALVPTSRPMGQQTAVLGDETGAGALAHAGAGQATRGNVLDFLGLPVRLAPSLGAKTELREEVALRSAAAGSAAAATVRPQVFAPLQQRLFPSFHSVEAEPDLSAWSQAAPSYGLRDARPTTLLAPDARAQVPTATSPLPQTATGGTGRLFGLPPSLAGPMVRDTLGTLGTPNAAPTGLAAPPVAAQPALAGVSSRAMPVSIPSAQAMTPLAWLGTPDRAPSILGAGVAPATAPIGPTPNLPPLPSAEPVGLPTSSWALGPAPHPVGHLAPTLRPAFEPVVALSPPPTRLVELPDMAGARPPAGTLHAEPLPATSALRAEPVPAGQGPPLRATFRPVASMPAPEPLLPHPEPLATVALSGPRAALPDPIPQPTQHAAPPSAPPHMVPLLAREARPEAEPAVDTPAAAQAPVSLPSPTAMPRPAPTLAAAPAWARSAQPAGSSATIGTRTAPLSRTVGIPASPRVAMPSLGLPSPPPAASAPSMALPSAAAAAPRPTRMVSTVSRRAPDMLLPALRRDAGPLAIQKASPGDVARPATAAPRASEPQKASMLASQDRGAAANEIHLLANEVWSLLKRRLAAESERRGRW